MSLDKLKQYLKMPEMRTLWIFVLLLLAVLYIDYMFVPSLFWRVIIFVILSIIGTVVFFDDLRAIRSDISINIEKNRLDSIILNIADGLIVYNSDFKVLIFNKAAEEIFNLKRQDIVGKKITIEGARDPKSSILTRVIYPSLAPTVVRFSEPGVYPQIMDISFEDPRLELRVTTSRLVDENNRVVGFLKVVRDRTREIELLKSKSTFIKVAAHQLRTPLSAINWVFEALQGEKLPEDQKQTLEMGASAANNLSKIVEDLLTVSAIEEGRFGYVFQSFDLIQFLSSLLSQAEAMAKQYNVSIYFEPGTQSPLMVYGDPEKIGMALSNILDNGIKYNVVNGRVTVAVQNLKNKPFVRVSIQDTGVGISKEDLERIFSKFFRSSNVMTKETSGSGLGLYIARNVIRRHGGEIGVESELNRGTTFYFTLPTDVSVVPQKELVYNE